jgi:hypothetical protein
LSYANKEELNMAPSNLTLQKNSGGSWGKKRRFAAAQGIEAEIPQDRRRRAEELERKARFPALRAGNAPKFSKKIS